MIESSEQKDLQLSQIKEALDRLSRRVDGIQKSIDLVYADRDILEDLLGSIASLKEILISHKNHVDTAVKDVKSEIIEKNEAVEGKVVSLTDEVVSTIDKVLSSKKTLPQKKKWWKRW